MVSDTRLTPSGLFQDHNTRCMSTQPEPPSDIPQPFVLDPEILDFVQIEAMVPMRDGVKLFTIIVVKKGARGPAPILMTRTPYGARKRSLEVGYSSTHLASMMASWEEPYLDAGYIRVHQDVRGKFESEGVYEMMRPVNGPHAQRAVDHVTDTYDTIAWLIVNVPNNNGNVGMIGVSYGGFLSLLPVLGPHPALKATVPINPMVDAWVGDDFYHNGAWRLSELEYYYTQTTTKDNKLSPPYGSYDIYSFYIEAGSAAGAAKRMLGGQALSALDRYAAHPTYDDFWTSNSVDRRLAELIELTVPTLHVHSWFDAEDSYGAVTAYEVLKSKDHLGTLNRLAAGPWTHGQSVRTGDATGAMKWDIETSLWFRRNVLTPFLDEHLWGRAPATPQPRVHTFETGTNEWRMGETWPPVGSQPRPLFLRESAGLSFDRPATQEPTSYDSYVSDPHKPVPYRMRPIPARARHHTGWSEWLLDDQRGFSDRPDVVTWCSAPLTEPLTVAGEVIGQLFASTTGSDVDWIVKLIDLYPDEYPRQPELGGYQFMISGEVLRGRYRAGFEVATPIPPEVVLEYRVRMPHVHHTFRRGHRIMVHVQSTWFPLYDRNPQTFVPDIYHAPAEAYATATQRIYRTAEFASAISLPIVGS